MPLIKTTLKTQIFGIMTEMRRKEQVSDDAFADKLATAIDTYIKSATITVPAGIAVATAGSPTAQTGATTAPMNAIIS